MSLRVQLPWDCLLPVFRQADPATLAVLGRVSLDFLTATAPLLYKDVEVKSLKALGRLFLQRGEIKYARVDGLLSLGQIETFTVELPKWARFIVPQLSLSRSPNSSALELQKLRIVIHHRSASKTGEIFRYLHPSLFELLNPVKVECDLQERPFTDKLWYYLGPQGSSVLAWSRITSLEMSGCIPFLKARGFPQAFALPAPDRTSRREYRFHVDTLTHTRCTNLGILLKYFVMVPSQLGLEALQSESVVLVVKTAQRKVEAEADVERRVPAEWREIFTVELEA